VLVVRLLAALAHWRHRLPSGPQLQEAAYRLVSRFLCLASKSPSPVVARLAAAREAGRLAPQDARSFLGCAAGASKGRVVDLQHFYFGCVSHRRQQEQPCRRTGVCLSTMLSA
jgi:hypothetical protein